MRIPKIKIETTGIITRIFVDGQELKGVRAIEFKHSADTNRNPVLSIDLIASDMEIDAVLVPELPEIYKPFYKEKETD